ncbi:MAG: hypothetical protein AAFX45_14835 [Pseudomonadota bacterium]
MPRVFVLVLAVVFGTPAVAGPQTPAERAEFGLETFHMLQATQTLFDALEAASADTDKPGLQLRLADPAAEPAALDLPPAGQMAIRTDLGPVANLRGYGVTWYPTDRLLGSVDFVGTWNNGRNLICGYATWDMSDSAAPVLASVTTSYIDAGALSLLTQEATHAALLRANCAYGAIEPNLDFVKPWVTQHP